MWQSMKCAPRGSLKSPHRFIALVRRKGFENFIPVTCYWCHGLHLPRWVFDGWKSGEEPMYWMDFPGEGDDCTIAPVESAEVVDYEKWRCDQVVREEWQKAVVEFRLAPGSDIETVVGRIIDRIRFDTEDPE